MHKTALQDQEEAEAYKLGEEVAPQGPRPELFRDSHFFKIGHFVANVDGQRQNNASNS